MRKDTEKNVHVFCFNFQENGGENIILRSESHEGNLEQTLTLNSYGKTASMSFDCFTPERLRDLANSLEGFLEKNCQTQ